MTEPNPSAASETAPPQPRNPESRSSTIAMLVVGAIILTGAAWYVVDLALTPPKPDPATAPMEQIAAYMASSRGLARLPIAERKDFVLALVARCLEGRDDAAALADVFSRMAPSDVEHARNALFDIVKDQVLTDAKIYNKIPPEKREEFVRGRLAAFDELRRKVIGPERSLIRRIAGAAGTETDSDDWGQLILSRTTAGERHLAKPFVDHLARLIEQERATRHARRGASG